MKTANQPICEYRNKRDEPSEGAAEKNGGDDDRHQVTEMDFRNLLHKIPLGDGDGASQADQQTIGSILPAAPRLFLETFRGDSTAIFGNWRQAQVIALAILASALFFLNRKLTRSTSVAGSIKALDRIDTGISEETARTSDR